jgi:hypothetical protein
MDLMDVGSQSIIATFSVRNRSWQIKGTNYRYLFIQVKPVDE